MPPRTNGSADHSQASPSTEFFEALMHRPHEPLLQTADGTVRFDLLDQETVEHWYLTLHRGDVQVSHRRSKADAVVRVERALFDGLVRGRVNAMAATLRGDLVAEGDLGLVLLVQRLFPGASRAEEAGPAHHREE